MLCTDVKTQSYNILPWYAGWQEYST